jgi:hypothetical protein
MMPVLVWVLTVSLCLYLGFCLGRRYEWGIEEQRAAEEAERRARGGTRLNTIRLRR